VVPYGTSRLAVAVAGCRRNTLGNAAANDRATKIVQQHARMADGDARKALTALELGVITTPPAGDGAIHVVQGLHRCASPSNSHVAIVEDPSKHTLVDVDAFYFVHMHFDRVALDEAVRINNATVRNHDFGHPSNKPSA
jgi:hypothetical protein